MNLLKHRDGVYRDVATRLQRAANDNLEEMTAPLCRQSYDVERALASSKEAA